MKILFDQGTPVPLRKGLSSHEVDTVYEKGWSRFVNGDLLRATEEAGYDVFVTTDKNLKYQQNLQDRSLAVVVILSASWPKLRAHAEALCALIESAAPGDYTEFALPD
jgi:hypothetical protein